MDSLNAAGKGVPRIDLTETESKETLDAFIDAMIEVAGLAETDPEKLKAAPASVELNRWPS